MNIIPTTVAYTGPYTSTADNVEGGLIYEYRLAIDELEGIAYEYSKRLDPVSAPTFPEDGCSSDPAAAAISAAREQLYRLFALTAQLRFGLEKLEV